MSTNPQQPRPRHPRKRRDPRARLQTAAKPASSESATTEATAGRTPQPATTPARRSEATTASVLYPYVLSDLKLTGIFMAVVIALLVVLWIVLG